MNKKGFAFIFICYGLGIGWSGIGAYSGEPTIAILGLLIIIMTTICYEIMHISSFFKIISSGGFTINAKHHIKNIPLGKNNESVH